MDPRCWREQNWPCHMEEGSFGPWVSENAVKLNLKSLRTSNWTSDLEHNHIEPWTLREVLCKGVKYSQNSGPWKGGVIKPCIQGKEKLCHRTLDYKRDCETGPLTLENIKPDLGPYWELYKTSDFKRRAEAHPTLGKGVDTKRITLKE